MIQQAAVSTSIGPLHLPHRARLMFAAACTCRTPCRRFLVVPLVAVGPSSRRCQRVRKLFPTSSYESMLFLFLHWFRSTDLARSFSICDNLVSRSVIRTSRPLRMSCVKLIGTFTARGSGPTFRPPVRCASGIRNAGASDTSELLYACPWAIKKFASGS